MKRILLGSAALVIAAGAANAADLPRKAPLYKAPPAVSYDWNGFYLGGYYGDAIGNSKTHTDPSGVTGTEAGTSQLNDKGVTAGVTAGYNWQFSPSWLVGLEGDIGYMDLNRTNVEWNDDVMVGLKSDWYGTLRARFGYVTGPSLLYVTGGAAFVHMRDTFGGDLVTVGPTTSTSTATGWTVGGGIETKLSRAWTAKTEYLFIDAGNASFASNPYADTGVPTTVDHSFHVIKTGLNYKIGEPFLEGLPLFGPSTQFPSDHKWGGFYAGINLGGGISNIHTIGGGTSLGAASEQDVNGTGFAGGGQLGYNYMITPKYFVGAEGDFGYLGVRGSERDWYDPRFNFADKTSWYGTLRARAGTSTGPALLYFTGGGAWVNLTDSLTGTGTGTTVSRTAGGWTFGGGTEVALDAHWSARIESFYIDAGHRNLAGDALGRFHSDFKDRFTVVRAGVSYAFGN
jgi:outer membrane immunogenic protein